MDKIAIIAVAGSGKTTYIIESLNLNNRFAVITYTTANQELLRTEVINKFGFIPDNIHIFGAWQFLYSFCLVPNLTSKPKGIIFDQKFISKHHRRNPSDFGVNKYIFNNMLSNFILKKKISYKERIDRYFDVVFVDEFQDFDSYDFDLLMSLSDISAQVILVGDYYQKTFSTSRKGNKGRGKDKSFDDYKNEIRNNGFLIDETSFIRSYRCTPNVCDFVNMKIGIHMKSNNEHISEVVMINDIVEIQKIMKNDSIKKLFYQQHYLYECNSGNWGECKGQTYERVCVVLNPNTARLYAQGKLSELASQTKSKFYVACTRTKTDLLFIEQNKIPGNFKVV